MNDYDEKQDEKYDEKQMQQEEKMMDEKETEEKNFEEKYRRDPLGTLVWAVILIWLGIVMLANNFGFLDRFQIPFSNLPFEIPFFNDVWPLFFIGAGFILLIEVLIRLTVPEYRRPVMGTVIMAVVFIGMGLGNWDLIWPLVLIAVGASILLRGLFRGR
jgi:hypothetical protein